MPYIQKHGDRGKYKTCAQDNILTPHGMEKICFGNEEREWLTHEF